MASGEPRQQYPGRPLNVIIVKEDPEDPKGKRKVEVNEEALAELVANLKQMEKEGVRKMSIVSLLGAFRTGKSFMLDLFIRYLAADQRVSDASAVRDGWRSQDQIDVYSTSHKVWCKGIVKDQNDRGNLLTVTYKRKSANNQEMYYEKECQRDDPALRSRRDHERLIFGENANFGDGEHESLFRWRSSEERCTTGIWFYSHPFVRKTPRGDKIGIILMDTQGLFDPQSPPQINNAIFGLTTLLSSYQILNVQGRIQQNTLDELHYFIEFAHSSISRFFAENGGERQSTEEEQKNRFQALEFLVRDWQNYTDPEDLHTCLQENTKSLDKAFARHFDDNGARERIENSFERVSAFMLPHPGMKMVRRSWDGQSRVIEEDFKRLAAAFIKQVFDERLTIKKDLASKEDLSVGMFEQYIKQFTGAFADGQMPEAVGMVKAWATAVNLNAKDEALGEFEREMIKKVGPGKQYIDEEAFSEVTQRAKDQASEVFLLKAQYGPEEDREKTKGTFMEDLDRRIEMYREQNESRVDKILASWSLACFIALVALSVDFASDYVCDWWLPVCYEGSRLLKLVYSVIFGAVGVRIMLLWQSSKNSKQTVIRAGFGLFGETMARAGEYADAYDVKQYLGGLGGFLGSYQRNEGQQAEGSGVAPGPGVQATNTAERDRTQHRRKKSGREKKDD